MVLWYSRCSILQHCTTPQVRCVLLSFKNDTTEHSFSIINYLLYIQRMPNNKNNEENWIKWKDIKSTFHEYMGSEEELSNWADSVVQSIWRPVSVGIVIGIPAIWAVSRFVVGTRYKTASHIPPEIFERSTKIRGKVVAVGDSDNFRLYHTPGLGWGWIRNIPKTRKELQNQTISIRIAGVDAPEGAHFGMPAQPYSSEAKQFLTKLVLNKRVQVQLLSRDQYSRVVRNQSLLIFRKLSI